MLVVEGEKEKRRSFLSVQVFSVLLFLRSPPVLVVVPAQGSPERAKISPHSPLLTSGVGGTGLSS